MEFVSRLTALMCIALMTGYSYAAKQSIEFSADAVISTPQYPVNQTKLFVSKDAVRSEKNINGQDIVEIVYLNEGRTVLINDSLKEYKEKTVLQPNKIKTNSPCDQIIDAVCEKIGAEEIAGIKTEKWQITSNSRGKKLQTLHWIDVKRKLAIREFFPDGSVAELKMLKKEKVNGRDTEKWQRSLIRPDGKVINSYQWYDTGLKIAIKEELLNGYIRELKNIKVKKQPVSLFNVPSNYKKIEFQPAMQPGYMNR